MHAHHGPQQALDLGKGIAQPVVVHGDDVVAERGYPDPSPMGVLEVVTWAGVGGQRGERGEHRLEIERPLGARLDEGLAPATAVVEPELLEDLGPDGSLGDQRAEGAVGIYRAGLVCGRRLYTMYLYKSYSGSLTAQGPPAGRSKPRGYKR